MNITDANIDAFIDALYAGKTVMEVDLMAANPDVREQCIHPFFIVSLVKVSFEGREYFVAHADNADNGDDFKDNVSIHDEKDLALDAVDRFIMDWKRAWDLCI